MRSVKSRACSVTLAVALTTIGVAAAMTAAAAPAHADGNAPSDCSYTLLDGGLSASFTCTDRPATQVWNILVLCHFNGMSGTVVAGNEVTGNGTSTAYCGYYVEGASFIIDS
jgi:hypothetical protein